VLDPAAGTGSYLVEVARRIHQTLTEQGHGSLAATRVKRALRTRISRPGNPRVQTAKAARPTTFPRQRRVRHRGFARARLKWTTHATARSSVAFAGSSGQGEAMETWARASRRNPSGLMAVPPLRAGQWSGGSLRRAA
jgi:hypothetical protein